ncbi:D-2-hydroxyglutarate dehydrogenase, mitochondrial-like [Tachypleus tridentatus]|uniref:D-2-hydroxyglutarate dehydrogenase, mitochondrial-like n=1 Tax=Tachypleus tridentatus TaxID=6853 RepID=UPI003FD6393B
MLYKVLLIPRVLPYETCKPHFKYLNLLFASELSKMNSISVNRKSLKTHNHGTLTHSGVELTSKQYSRLKRGPFTELSSKDLEFFQRLLGQEKVLADVEELDGYNTDWMKMFRGSSSLVLRPKTTDEVSEILKYCNKHKLAVCPQGGNTGLVGGSVPVFDEIILSTTLMNNILTMDELSGSLECQAGCVLENLETYANEHGFMIPLDLGSKGSCQIGGNIATNAGGLRLMRYGSLHANVLGLEVVLGNGQIVNCMSKMRKDNTGFDLKHFFIGCEGLLGIITKVGILTPPKPQATTVAFLGCYSFEKVLETYRKARQNLGEIISSFEMMDHQAMEVVEQNLNMKNPVSVFPFYVLIETSGSRGDHDEEKLISYLESSMEKGIICDGTVVSETSHIKNIWSLRERITEGLLHDGHCYKYDISLPLNEYYKIVEVMREKLQNKILRCVAYGHLGDGNLHLNITSKNYDPDILHEIEPFLYEWTAEHKGSISAEHGLGLKKRDFINYCKSPSAVAVMKQLKQLFDPNGILNPYKMLPATA